MSEARSFPVGFLHAESPLCALWPNRMIALKTARPIVMLGHVQFADLAVRIATGCVHIADLTGCTAEQLAAIAAALPDAPSVQLLAAVREVAIDEKHFESVV